MYISITGSSRGFGFELTKTLLERGHHVQAVLRSEQTAQELYQLKRRFPKTLEMAFADVTDERQMALAAQSVPPSWGGLDAVVHNAGILLDSDREKPMHKSNLADLRATLETNTIGPVIAVQTYYPVMKKNKNAPFIIVTSEGCDIRSSGSWVPAYALSKCAATKIASIMNATVKDVPFYALHPGRVKTEMGKETWQIEASEAAQATASLLENGMPDLDSCWYVNYQGQCML